MRFEVDPAVFETFPDVFIGVVVAWGADNTTGSDKTAPRLTNAIRNAREQFGSPADVVAHPVIARWRKAFEIAGLNPNKYKSSVEALLTRVAKGDDIGSISPIVDCVNVVSMTDVVPVGAHDLSRIVGDTIQVRYSREGDVFTPFSATQTEPVPTNEIVYADIAEVRTRRWVWRQGEKAKTTAATTSVFCPIDGFADLNETEVRLAAHTLARLLHETTGAQTATYWLNRANPAVTFDLTTPTEVSNPDNSDHNIVGEVSNLDSSSQTQAGMSMTAPTIISSGTLTRDADLIDSILTRGVVDIVTREELEAKLKKATQPLRIKYGIDPTSPNVHIGRSVPILKMRDFQRLGHQAVLIIGEYTTLIGDASDKTDKRPVLTHEQVRRNMTDYRRQISMILDEAAVEWHYNSEWFSKMELKDFMALCQIYTVQQMIERENFALRLNSGRPVGLHELMYPLLQGYDSVAIKADVELGGTDQLFNLMAGRRLQEHFGQKPQAILMTGMVNGLDNEKMSSSKGNVINIAEAPRDQYGKVMSMADDMITTYFEYMTRVPMADVQAMEEQRKNGANPMQFKKRLAYTIVQQYHGDDAAEQAQGDFEKQFQKHETPDEMPEFQIDAPQMGLRELLVATQLAPSNKEAKRKIEEGAVQVDGVKQSQFDATIPLHDKLIVKLGRKFARVRQA